MLNIYLQHRKSPYKLIYELLSYLNVLEILYSCYTCFVNFVPPLLIPAVGLNNFLATNTDFWTHTAEERPYDITLYIIYLIKVC